MIQSPTALAEIQEQFPALDVERHGLNDWDDDRLGVLLKILNLEGQLRILLEQFLELSGNFYYGDGPDFDPLLQRGELKVNGDLAIRLHSVLGCFLEPLPNSKEARLGFRGAQLLTIIREARNF